VFSYLWFHLDNWLFVIDTEGWAGDGWQCPDGWRARVSRREERTKNEKRIAAFTSLWYNTVVYSMQLLQYVASYIHKGGAELSYSIK
jgi:hypothetical protein